MTIHKTSIRIPTEGRGTIDITQALQQAVGLSAISSGLCNIFVHHTSASLILCENADPTVRDDLERFMARLAPDGDPIFQHVDEGVDDMPAHVRSVVTQSSISIPVEEGRCDLGTWQGVFLWEHRTSAHTRRVSITVFG